MTNKIKNKTNLSLDEMINLYKKMYLIRLVEEQLGEDLKKGNYLVCSLYITKKQLQRHLLSPK